MNDQEFAEWISGASNEEIATAMSRACMRLAAEGHLLDHQATVVNSDLFVPIIEKYVGSLRPTESCEVK